MRLIDYIYYNKQNKDMKITNKQKQVIVQYLQRCRNEFNQEDRVGNWHLRNPDLRYSIDSLLIELQARVYDETLGG